MALHAGPSSFKMMPPYAQKRRRRATNLYTLLAINAGGVAACLFLTIHFHHALGNHDRDVLYVDVPSPGLPANSHQQSRAADDAAAIAGGKMPQRPDDINRQHAVPKPPPHPTKTTAHEEGVSACLLVNDENPRLPEWIAYHYQTLPLRSLIVAVDPASRSSPNEILMRWYTEMGLEVSPMPEKAYLPPKMRGPCTSNDPDHPDQCLWHHRDRQDKFITKCMLEFKKMNKTWVLLTDVDEYIQFNQVRDDDPKPPLDEPPEGVKTMSDWKDEPTEIPNTFVVSGWVNGKYTMSDIIVRGKNDANIKYGSVVEDMRGKKFFLRDDIAFREATALHTAPKGMPTLRAYSRSFLARGKLFGRVYNDTYNNEKDAEFIPVPMNWTLGDERMRRFYGGHFVEDTGGHVYFMENEAKLWPPHYLAKDAIAARKRLPSVGEGKTVLDVLKREANESYTQGALGPCLSIPRLLYGSREENGDKKWSPDGFDDEDFVTLRFPWHASKGAFEASKYGKTIIDVSRIPASDLRGKAVTIHRPLRYHCREEPPRYEMALFRVNHYLDSFEAYSYRNDVRSHRQCKECYEKKGRDAAIAKDDDIRPWLRQFVESVGPEKAKKLLANAGDFVKLQNNSTQ